MQTKLPTIVATLTLSAVSLLAQSPQTLKGTVSDSMCGAKHMMSNLSAAQCTRGCIKHGADYALVSGSKVYTMKGDKAQFDKYAGQNVTVKGTISGDTVTVTSITGTKS